VINSLVLIAGSTFVLSETIPRLFNPEPARARGMLFLALFGVLVNGWAALGLKKGHSINEKVVFLHLLEDVLGWMAVLLGSVVMILVRFPLIDPLLSVLITLFILFNVFKNLKQSFRVFLQAVPAETDLRKIEKIILDTPGVESIHDFHVWSLDGQYNILTLHLIVNEPDNYPKIRRIRNQIKQSLQGMKIDHITIEIHQRDEECFLDECT
jgi:cobalt-zinc-cadmium efflux system protein